MQQLKMYFCVLRITKMMMSRSKTWSIFITAVIATTLTVTYFLILGSSNNEEPQVVRMEVPIAYRAVKIPDSVSFAGEPVPVERFDTKESLDRELLVNSYFHSQTLRLIKLAPRYFSIIEPILEEKGVPDDFKYLAVAESGLNPRAVSPARAVGLWQFLATTGQEYGLEVNSEVDERYHVEKSTYAACDYLLKAYSRYGSWSLVAAAYNGGLAGIERQVKRQKVDVYYDLLFGEETSRYVFRIIALKLIMENPAEYNFLIAEDEKYPVIETRDIVVEGRVDDFADFAFQHNINYKLLKDFNPWLRENNLTNTGKKKYTIKVPVLD
ncbi:MAG TPA: lytic transglycosylase domain-containing protein [Mariniphaga sp.]|nr:lytic transglycosylase domain-containing protein [Mariniphaga sp.]